MQGKLTSLQKVIVLCLERLLSNFEIAVLFYANFRDHPCEFPPTYSLQIKLDFNCG